MRTQAVLFPGFLSIGLGLAGAAIALREPNVPAATLAAFPRPRNGDALWLDRDPDVLGVARSTSRFVHLLYATIPIFSFLRAPERMGIVVMLCLAVLAAFAVRELCRRFPARAPRHRHHRVRGGSILELNDRAV